MIRMENLSMVFPKKRKKTHEEIEFHYIYIYIYIYICMYVFTTEGFFEVAIESWPKWDLNPRPLNSVHTL